MHDGMPYDLMQGQGQGHDCLKATQGVDRQSRTGQIFSNGFDAVGWAAGRASDL